MDSKQKSFLNIVNKFFLNQGCKKVTLTIDGFYASMSPSLSNQPYQFFCDGKRNFAPVPVEPMAIDLINQVNEFYAPDSDDEYYDFDLFIYPENKEIELKGNYTKYVTGDIQNYEYFTEDYSQLNTVFDKLDDEGSDIIAVQVDAGGDSGWINPEQTDMNGKIIDLSEELQDFCYSVLTNFPGWEINEGSHVIFEFYPSVRMVKLEFAYNDTESASELLYRGEF